VGPALALTPAIWICTLDVAPELVPAAVIVWGPVRLTPRTIASQNPPLESATAEGKWVPLSNEMVTVSPGLKPEPQNLRLDPAAGV